MSRVVRAILLGVATPSSHLAHLLLQRRQLAKILREEGNNARRGSC
jgi:hypothetical protein